MDPRGLGRCEHRRLVASQTRQIPPVDRSTQLGAAALNTNVWAASRVRPRLLVYPAPRPRDLQPASGVRAIAIDTDHGCADPTRQYSPPRTAVRRCMGRVLSLLSHGRSSHAIHRRARRIQLREGGVFCCRRATAFDSQLQELKPMRNSCRPTYPSDSAPLPPMAAC